jgi:hypothetical protein
VYSSARHEAVPSSTSTALKQTQAAPGQIDRGDRQTDRQTGGRVQFRTARGCSELNFHGTETNSVSLLLSTPRLDDADFVLPPVKNATSNVFVNVSGRPQPQPDPARNRGRQLDVRRPKSQSAIYHAHVAFRSFGMRRQEQTCSGCTRATTDGGDYYPFLPPAESGHAAVGPSHAHRHMMSRRARLGPRPDAAS